MLNNEKPTRLLLVDDEESILVTLSAILKQHGFEVTTRSTVGEALQAIATESFHILLTDLNIGQPGDGFTVVSAMRRTQPKATTMILTGYPAFDSALEAIRQQVDEYLVKPVSPDELVRTIGELRNKHRTHRPIPTKRISDIVRDETQSIIAGFVDKLRTEAPSREVIEKLTDQELVDHMPFLLTELSRQVDEDDRAMSKKSRREAIEHGETRAAQNFDPVLMMFEGTAIRQTVLAAVHRNLLHLNLSYLFTDLAKMSDCLDDQLRVSMEVRLGGRSASMREKSDSSSRKNVRQ